MGLHAHIYDCCYGNTGVTASAYRGSYICHRYGIGLIIRVIIYVCVALGKGSPNLFKYIMGAQPGEFGSGHLLFTHKFSQG